MSRRRQASGLECDFQAPAHRGKGSSVGEFVGGPPMDDYV